MRFFSCSDFFIRFFTVLGKLFIQLGFRLLNSEFREITEERNLYISQILLFSRFLSKVQLKCFHHKIIGH